MQLQWGKSEGLNWCDFLKLNLAHELFDGLEGVYVIWHGGTTPATVRVGQGVIRDRLAAHRREPDILSFAHLGLFVTWAQVAAWDRDGVEAYLAQKLAPKVGDRFPDRAPVLVDLPW